VFAHGRDRAAAGSEFVTERNAASAVQPATFGTKSFIEAGSSRARE